MNVSAGRPLLLPTSVVGSHGLPGWVWLAREALEAGRLGTLVLRCVPAERLWLNPDCGFWETPRWVVKHKLAALVQGARIVRKELGG